MTKAVMEASTDEAFMSQFLADAKTLRFLRTTKISSKIVSDATQGSAPPRRNWWHLPPDYLPQGDSVNSGN